MSYSEMMKVRKDSIIAPMAFFVAAFLLISPGLSFSAQAQNSTPGQERVIQVSASGESSADPDMIVLNVEVWSKGPTAKEAQSLNASMSDKVYKVLEKFAIKKTDIVTNYFSVNPETIYDQQARQSRIVGFNTNHSLRVTHRKIEEGGSLIDSLSGIERNKMVGVNLNGISWDYSKRNALEIETLATAVKEAKLRADELAKAAGVQIKKVLSLSHSAGGGDYVRPMFRGKAMSLMADAAGGAAPETSLSSGQIKVRVNVTAEYEIQ